MTCDPEKDEPISDDIQKVYRSGLHEIASMAGPAIVTMSAGAVMHFVDFIMVSTLGTNETAAFNPAGLTIFVFVSFISGVMSCTNTFASQSYAKKNYADCSRYAWQGIHVSLAMGLLLLVALWPLAPGLFSWIGHGSEVVPREIEYFRWRLPSIAFMGVCMTLSGFFQGVSRPAVTMVAAVIANAINVFGNWVLIFGKLGFPELGIGGAGMATSFATVIQAAIMMGLFLSGSRARLFHTRRVWRWDYHRTVELLRIGWWAGLNWTLDIACWWVFTSFLVGKLGKSVLAASNVSVQLMRLSFFPTLGLRIAVSAIVGQHVGRRDFATARARVRTSIFIGMGYMGMMGLIFFLFRHQLMSFFSDDTDIIAIGARMLVFTAVFQAFDALCILYSGALKGAGDTRTPALLSIAMGWIVFLPVSYVLTYTLGWGTDGAYTGMTIFITVLGILLFFRWRHGAWEKIDIFRKHPYEPAHLATPPAPYEPGEDVAEG